MMKKELCDLSRTVVYSARHCRRANPDERANARERPKHLRRELCRRGRCHFDFVFSSLPFNSPLIIKGRAASFSLSQMCDEGLLNVVLPVSQTKPPKKQKQKTLNYCYNELDKKKEMSSR